MRRSWVGFVVGMLVMLAALGVATPAFSQTLRVTAPEAGVRLYPDERSPVIATVKAGTLLELKAKMDAWYAVLLPAGDRGLRQYGFVKEGLVELVDIDAGSRPDGAGPKRLANQNPPAAEKADAPPWPIEWDGDPQTGAYVSVMLPYNRFRDPELAGGYGWGFSAGRRSPRHSVDVTFAQSSHVFTGQRQIVEGDRESQTEFTGGAIYRRFSVDTKRYWHTGTQILPYLHVAFGIPWLTVKEGAIIDGVSADVCFVGVGFDVGGGVAVPVNRRVIVELGAVQRFDFFLGAKVGTGEAEGWTELERVLIERGPRFATSVTLLF
jgi:hypothetical protein